ncbi:MAG: NAD-binding protein [Deltaproteobacteria bacterium]|nr:NAD-binding protein [Deltaproteobacteria bacterium]
MINRIKEKIQIVLWTGSISVVIVIGLFYFPREYSKAGFWETLYFTLRLFVFEHDLPTFPKSGPLIFIYFLAPLITISAVGTAISYIFRISPSLKTRWMSDHVVICGIGRTGKLFATSLKEKGVKVVGVDLGPQERYEDWASGSKVPIIVGNFNSRALLEKAGMDKARSIIFASGDDLDNLNGALSAYEWLQTKEGPFRLIWAQIANEQLAGSARSAVRTHGKIGIRFFDTYRIAAIKMIDQYFNREIRQGINEANILGFGKFGHDFMDVLVNNFHEDEKMSIRVIDINDREADVRSLAEELDVSDRVTFERADIQHMYLDNRADNAFFICTDDDLSNLITTMLLAAKTETTHIYARMDHWPLSAVSENLGEEHGVVFVNINDLVVQGIAKLPGIFKPAKAEDLRRSELGKSSPGA